MNRLLTHLACLLPCFVAANCFGQPPARDETHTIFGIVQELRSGTPDVPVCLCDGETGMPLSKDGYQPIEWGKSQPANLEESMAITKTDDKGRFRFENVPDGKYRLVAQKWIGPFKGIFQEHGTVIQLMGTADDIVVPRPKEYQKALVALTPPGHGIVRFDQRVPNSDTFLFLSMVEPQFDPIMGLQAMGKPFLKNLVGVNRMPLGKTTVINAPAKPLYAFFFAPDNSPGFATVSAPPSKHGLTIVSAEPFVAGWSDGRRTPPPKLAELSNWLDERDLKIDKLLNIPELSLATHAAYTKRTRELSGQLDRIVDLPEGRKTRVADLLSVKAYRRLAK